MIITKETDYALRMLRVLPVREKLSATEIADTALISTQLTYHIP